MPDLGEELVGTYLRYVEHCELVGFNVKLKGAKGTGEIDVVGINLRENKAFFCEVATQLVLGLQYANRKTNQPANVEKLVNKFERDIEYASHYFPRFKHVFMFWSPVVKSPKNPDAKHNQLKDVNQVVQEVKEKYGKEVELVINERYWNSLQELRQHAKTLSEASDSPVMRMLQIEEWLKKHLNKGDASTT